MDNTRILNWILFIGCIVIFLLSWVLPILHKLGLPMYRCPYRIATGSPCLFCGTITSFSLMVRGNIIGAMNCNPVGVFLFFFIILVFVIMATRLLLNSARE